MSGNAGGIGAFPLVGHILAMQSVVVVALDGVVPFDMAAPCEVFGRARTSKGEQAYEVLVAGVTRDVQAERFTIRTHHGLRALEDADTVIEPASVSPCLPQEGDRDTLTARALAG
jgi:hypothetical protein